MHISFVVGTNYIVPCINMHHIKKKNGALNGQFHVSGARYLFLSPLLKSSFIREEGIQWHGHILKA